MSDSQALIDYLAGFVTDRRYQTMRRVLSSRTRYVTVAVEDIYQPHNASAVLRTCDAFGVQDVHIIENRNRYRVNPGVELGTSQWLTLHRHRAAQDNTAAAVARLRQAGYRVVATTPHTDDVELAELSITDGPVALLFGNELDGLSDRALDLCDEYVRIDMHGFVESFNISVSAAIVLHHLTRRMRAEAPDWQLSDEERQTLLLRWLRRNVKNHAAIERQFLERSGERERG
jgi:tRNA (guanosine-2'-O-)-methyltransferase